MMKPMTVERLRSNFRERHWWAEVVWCNGVPTALFTLVSIATSRVLPFRVTKSWSFREVNVQFKEGFKSPSWYALVLWLALQLYDLNELQTPAPFPLKSLKGGVRVEVSVIDLMAMSIVGEYTYDAQIQDELASLRDELNAEFERRGADETWAPSELYAVTVPARFSLEAHNYANEIRRWLKGREADNLPYVNRALFAGFVALSGSVGIFGKLATKLSWLTGAATLAYPVITDPSSDLLLTTNMSRVYVGYDKVANWLRRVLPPLDSWIRRLFKTFFDTNDQGTAVPLKPVASSIPFCPYVVDFWDLASFRNDWVSLGYEVPTSVVVEAKSEIPTAYIISRKHKEKDYV